MADRVAVVTGGGRGVGAAIARQLSVDDWVVVLADLGTSLDGHGYDPDPAQEVAADIWQAGGSARPVCADVTTRSGLEFVLETATSLGSPMALVHAAGVLADQPLPEMTDEAWRSVLAVHLDAAFAASRAFWPLFESAGGGSIVLLGASAGFVGAPDQANYAAAKAGLLGLTRVLAQEGVVAGITANLVLPFADTRMSPQARGDWTAGDADRDDQGSSANRPGEPGAAAARAAARAEDVAPLVSWLCSEAGGGVTGQVLGVRGAELTVWSQPRPVSRIVATEGWHPQALAALLHPAQTTHMTPLDTDADVLGGPVIPVRNPHTVQGQVLPKPERRLSGTLPTVDRFPGEPPTGGQPQPGAGAPKPQGGAPGHAPLLTPAPPPASAEDPESVLPPIGAARPGAAGGEINLEPELEPDASASGSADDEPELVVDLEHDGIERDPEGEDAPARSWTASLLGRRRR